VAHGLWLSKLICDKLLCEQICKTRAVTITDDDANELGVQSKEP